MNSTGSARCKTILVVEDDTDIRETLREILEAEGYVVRTAENGEEGLEALSEITRPCVILLDIMMPVMNGFEFLAALREAETLVTIPVVIVSAFTDLSRQAKGAAGLVKKPIDLHVLLAFVDRYCKNVAPDSQTL